MQFQKFGKWILDLVFPLYCLSCSHEGSIVCNRCASGLRLYTTLLCSWCRTVTGGKEACEACKRRFSIDALVVLHDFHVPLVRDIVHACKYQSIRDAGNFMGEMLGEHVRAVCNFSEKPIVLPIPLHAQRLKEQDRNHAAVIGSACAQKAGFAYDENLLARVRSTISQTELTKEERHKNVSGAFACAHAESLSGRTVILVDDVCTTGATLQEAARVLKNAGVCSVVGAVFARG